MAWACDWLAVWRAGGRPVRLSPSREIPEGLAGLMVGGGDDEPPLPYGIAALMPMVAAAPANLQTREVVFEVPKK